MRPTGSRRAAKKDGNDAALAAYARQKWGWEIIHQPPGNGFDWLALLPGGRKEIIEIKNPDVAPSARKLTEQEVQLFEACALRGISYRLVENEAQIDRIHNEKVSAEVFPPGVFIADEMAARGWSIEDLAKMMPGDSAENYKSLLLLIVAPKKEVVLDEATAEKLGVAFGIAPAFFLNLDTKWREE